MTSKWTIAWLLMNFWLTLNILFAASVIIAPEYHWQNGPGRFIYGVIFAIVAQLYLILNVYIIEKYDQS